MSHSFCYISPRFIIAFSILVWKGESVKEKIKWYQYISSLWLFVENMAVIYMMIICTCQWIISFPFIVDAKVYPVHFSIKTAAIMAAS